MPVLRSLQPQLRRLHADPVLDMPMALGILELMRVRYLWKRMPPVLRLSVPAQRRLQQFNLRMSKRELCMLRLLHPAGHCR